ncbi:hypothetical protein COCMIDRAFT_82101 [Bipolaris oryzae ATCC 44560]|uniref:Rad21/Rec8-like protein N-terminal domain-containing protein n=1 Tax=Bipolaris oryzae ATCC 44560 TaxID=930090 RepID=W6ZF96_COCMI|nr:uncharacterized protein COCMIDRAFT_82101 [Bipolaris oryzae ATCC 44560]EUC50527.1 hypothetical protein COCMIDRAFT_82101 [Bipolaris oryzae ATCC 44560]
MFYSHEILTSRKYGVATVWLVATLGAKSSLKRINRKQILDVDVSKACQTIIDPVAPLALRLQGNLLYGLSRVYLQQCGYILSDAQNAQLALRMALRTVQNTELDPAAGKANPQQLILQDDPSFLPDFAPPPPELLADLDFNFNLDITHSGESQSLTPFGSQQYSSSSRVGSAGGLILPPSSPVTSGGFGLEGDYGIGSIGQHSAMLGAGDTIEIEDPDFEFGDDGEIIHLSPGAVSLRTLATPARAPRSGNAGQNDKVRKDPPQSQQALDQLPDDELHVALPGEEDGLPEGGSYSSSGALQSQQSSEVVESSETFTAPMRRHRLPRAIPADTVTELRNKDLIDWGANYLKNMRTATKQKIHNRALTQAKKNAEHYVWESGLGGIGQRIHGREGYNPFDMFMGDKLFEAITGMSRKVTGRKHDRDSGIDDATQEQARRVRQKSGELEAARGADDEGFSMPLGDDEAAVELPREAAPTLDDQHVSSAMPWNMSASARSSSAIPCSRRIGMTSSTDHGRHRSRLVSASPLHGRGPSIPFDLNDLTSDADYAGNEFRLSGLSSDFPEVAALPNTNSQVPKVLSIECENFITYICEKMRDKGDHAQIETGVVTNAEEITFEELLPPTENTKMIACHGLMMVLTLGTRGMLDIQQSEHLGDIHLRLSEKTKVLEIIEISDGEDELEEEDEQMEDPAHVEDEGHFREQFAAGHAAQVDDGHESFYDD